MPPATVPAGLPVTPLRPGIVVPGGIGEAHLRGYHVYTLPKRKPKVIMSRSTKAKWRRRMGEPLGGHVKNTATGNDTAVPEDRANPRCRRLTGACAACFVLCIRLRLVHERGLRRFQVSWSSKSTGARSCPATDSALRRRAVGTTGRNAFRKRRDATGTGVIIAPNHRNTLTQMLNLDQHRRTPPTRRACRRNLRGCHVASVSSSFGWMLWLHFSSSASAARYCA